MEVEVISLVIGQGGLGWTLRDTTGEIGCCGKLDFLYVEKNK